MNNNNKNNNYVEGRVKDFLVGLYNLRSANGKNYKMQTVFCGIKEAEDERFHNLEYTNRSDYKFIKDMISGNFGYQKYESENVLLVKPHRKSLDVGGVVLEKTLKMVICYMEM